MHSQLLSKQKYGSMVVFEENSKVFIDDIFLRNQKKFQFIKCGLLEIYTDNRIFNTDNFTIIVLGRIYRNILSNNICFNIDIYDLIIELYLAQGDTFYKYLDGFFLIFLYDKRNNKTLICNNRYNATRLYYNINHGKGFIAANTLSLLLNIIKYKTDFSLRSLPSFLQTGFSYTEKTQFQDIERLLPTYALVFTEKNKKIEYEVINHWKDEFSFDRVDFDNLEEQLDLYEKYFSGSVNAYLSINQAENVGCLLSGGQDTSYVFLQLVKNFDKPIHSFTASFENFSFNESPKAKYLTDKYKGIHHEVLITSDDLNMVPNIIKLCEEPAPGGSFPIFACIREAARYVDCLFTGDAGDTLWAEYYPVAEWHSYLKNIPYIGRKLFYNIASFLSSVFDWERFWEMKHVAALFAEKDIYNDFFTRLCTYRHYEKDMLKTILNKDIFPKVEVNSSACSIPFNKDNFSDMLIEAKMFFGVYQYMIPVTQKPVEFLGMDFCPPYFNKPLIDFICSLPQAWLNGGCSFRKLTNKAYNRKFHKKALLRHLSPSYVNVAQQSCDVPFNLLFAGRPYVLDLLLRRLKKRGWYDNSYLERLFAEFKAQKPKEKEIIELKLHGYRIFCLLSFEVWAMEFLDKKPNLTNTTINVELEDYLA